MAKTKQPVPETDDEHNDVVILMLDKPRELRLGHKAMKRFSALTHKKITQMQDALEDYETLSTLIYTMLWAEDKTLSPGMVDDLIDDAGCRQEDPLTLGDIYDAVSRAITAAFGGDADEQANGENSGETAEESPTPAAGTGETV